MDDSQYSPISYQQHGRCAYFDGRSATDPLFVSYDGKNAIVGQMIPFGRDPFTSTRATLAAMQGPALGADRPKIDIVVFTDFECAHCKLAHPILLKLAKDFPQTRLVFEHFPFPQNVHPWAMKAAAYAACTGHAKPFWDYVTAVFEKADQITAASADEKLQGIARTVGLNPSALATCAGQPATKALIDKSLALGQALDVNQVPTVFINGRRVISIATIPYESLKQLVHFEIYHANR
jgi:protein-disulfide isomerase